MAFSRLHITVILGFAAAVWGLTLYARGTQLDWDHLAPFSTVVGALVTLAICFERVFWPWRVLHGWFFKRPDLRGTWQVELQSSWIDPKTKKQIPPITCYMGIEQTLSSLQMHLMTPESQSWLIADQIRASPSGNGYQVLGIYTNKPQMHLRGDRSEMHQGALMLDAHGPKHRPTTLTGEYWTDRSTTGRLDFVKRVPMVFTKYEDAASAMNSH